MALGYYDITRQVDEARETMEQCNRCVREITDFIIGRLRQAEVSMYDLRKLKSELTKFNSHTGKWKD